MAAPLAMLQGGGIYISGRTATFATVTLNGNSAQGGNGASGGNAATSASARKATGGNAGNGGSIAGGGIYSGLGQVDLTSGSQITNNSAAGGTARQAGVGRVAGKAGVAGSIWTARFTRPAGQIQTGEHESLRQHAVSLRKNRKRALHGDCPNFRGGDDVTLKKRTLPPRKWDCPPRRGPRGLSQFSRRRRRYPEKKNVAAAKMGLSPSAAHGDCPDFHGGDDVTLKKRTLPPRKWDCPPWRHTGTVPIFAAETTLP